MAQDCSILIIDDDRGQCETLVDILSEKGFRTQFSLTGTEAIEKASNLRPDIVLVDLRLPDMSGEDVMKRIKESNPETELVVVTGHASLESAIKAINTRAFAYNTKPLNIEQLLLTIERIRERQKLARALKESEKRYEHLLTYAADMIYALDTKGNFTFASQALLAALGYSREELVGKNLQIIVAEEFHSLTSESFQKRISGETVPKYEFDLLKKDGTRLSVESNANVVRDPEGDIVGMQAILRDITERKRAEREMRNLFKLYQRTLSTVPSFLLLLDSKLNIQMANQSYLDGRGAKASEVVGKNITDVFPSALLSTENLLERIRKVADSGRRDELMGIRHTSGEHPERYLNIRICGIRLAKEEPLVLIVIDDVTEYRMLEEQLRHSVKMEAIGKLAGGIAHDFNNILTGIMGYTQLLLETSRDNPELKNDLIVIRELSDRAVGLTRQLLAFSRRQPLEIAVININALVENASSMLKRLIGEDIELRFVPAADLGNVRADASQIEQVLMNLTINARDAMPEGGKLTIETVNVTLGNEYVRRRVAVRPGEYVMLSVTDTGHGMDERTRARIFEPFFTTKAQGKGTGLGLSTTYGIVKQHQGNIWVYSEPGKGTTFKTYLPRVDVKKVQPLPKPREATGKWEEAVPGGDEVVLVAEDEDTVRDLMRRVLEDRGYAVLCAATVEEAETTARRHRGNVDLLVSDVVLRGCDGQTLYERLAADYPRLKAVYMSGYTERTIARQGRLDPATAFLEKPFSPDTLARVVRDALDK